MNPAVGPFAIAAGLLVVGGAAKAVRPRDTMIAARAIGLPARDATVRLGGAVEVVLGVVAVVASDVVVAALVAVSYLAFCAFVSTALVRHLPIASCGCVGRSDAPPSMVHVGVTAGAVVAAIGMAADASVSPLEAVERGVPEGVVFALLVTVGVLAAFVALTLVPQILSSRPPG